MKLNISVCWQKKSLQIFIKKYWKNHFSKD